MKVLAILSACLVLASLSEAQNESAERLKQLFVQCGRELGHAPEDLQRLLKEQSRELGCVAACVLKKNGEFKNGIIDIEGVISNIVKVHGEASRAQATQIMGKCVETGNKQSDDCAKGLVYMQCVIQLFKSSETGH